MTMALSTSTPTLRIRPNMIIMLRVSPCIQRKNSAIRKLEGIAKPTKSADLRPRAAMQTINTRMTALMIEELRLPTIS